jgi:hypothetical protein
MVPDTLSHTNRLCPTRVARQHLCASTARANLMRPEEAAPTQETLGGAGTLRQAAVDAVDICSPVAQRHAPPHEVLTNWVSAGSSDPDELATHRSNGHGVWTSQVR